MTNLYPVQVIALDIVAHQAVDLAELQHFTEVQKIERKELAARAIQEQHQILVLSDISIPILNEIYSELSEMEDPIMLLPKREQDDKAIKELILLGVRVVFAPSDTIVSFSLSQILKTLEMIFYGQNSKNEIVTDHKDIYTVLGKSTVTEFYESDGDNMSTVMMNALNTPRGFSDVTGVLALFEVSEDYPIIDVAEAMDILEELMPEECGIIFETRNTHNKNDYVKIICMVSHHIDFTKGLQKQINNAESYLNKASVIIDAAYEGSITYEEVQYLAAKNNISIKDLDTLYTIVYVDTADTVKLMRLLRDESISIEEKEEAVALALMETSMESNFLEELALTHKLSMDNIMAIKEHKSSEGETNETIQDKESSTQTV